MLHLLFFSIMLAALRPGQGRNSKVFVSWNFHDVHVEISHHELSFQPSIFAIDPNDETGVYEEVKNHSNSHSMPSVYRARILASGLVPIHKSTRRKLKTDLPMS